MPILNHQGSTFSIALHNLRATGIYIRRRVMKFAYIAITSIIGSPRAAKAPVGDRK